MIKPVDPKLFFSKNDPNDMRLGDFAKNNSDIQKESFVILGYPDDEGIKLSGGRPGAALAPQSIRSVLYRMTPSLNSPTPKITDLGDLIGHDEAFKEVKKILSGPGRMITLGGGHDYGYPDFAAFTEEALRKDKKPLIINFDAHLDVRPNEKGNNSGTPFYRLLEKYSKDITFFEIGVQDWCNSTQHLQWAKDHGAHVITLNEIMSSGKSLSRYLSERITPHIPRNCELGLSLDIDCFESGTGPGASQVFPVGLDATQLLLFWSTLISQFKARLMGVYEVSPPLDLDDRTSRLAAIFIHQFLFS